MSGRPFTERQNKFLRLWSETGRGRMSIGEFCVKNGYPKATVYQWRARNAKFREAMDGYEPPREMTVADIDSAVEEAEKADPFAELAAERWPNLPPWQGRFLEVWRDSVDRDTACRAVEKEWREIRELRKRSKRFDAAAREIEEVFQVRVEDAQTRSAIAGKAMATGSYLEARGSKLAKSAGKAKKGDGKYEAEDPKTTAERYAEIFKSHASRGAGTDVAN